MWSWKGIFHDHTCISVVYCGRGRLGTFHDHTYTSVVVEGAPSMTTFSNMWSWKVGNFFPMRAKSLFISLQHSLSTFTLICIISPSLLSTFTLNIHSPKAFSPPSPSSRISLLHFLFFDSSTPPPPSPSLHRLLPPSTSHLLSPSTLFTIDGSLSLHFAKPSPVFISSSSLLRRHHLSHHTPRLRPLAFASRLRPLTSSLPPPDTSPPPRNRRRPLGLSSLI